MTYFWLLSLSPDYLPKEKPFSSHKQGSTVTPLVGGVA